MHTMSDTDRRDIAYYAQVSATNNWHAAAHKAIMHLAGTGRPFTADDFRELMGDNQPSQPNAIGSIFRVYRKDGIIRPTGLFIESQAPSRNGGAIRQWVGTTPKAQAQAA